MPNVRSLMVLVKRLVIVAGLGLAACITQPTPPPTPATTPPTASPPARVSPTLTPKPSPTATGPSGPALTLHPGDVYFSLDGRPALVFARNLTGKTRADFALLLDWARQGGTRLIRLHLTAGWWGDPWINADGTVNEQWAQNWDWVFDQAQAAGLYVLPVFGVWSDWNNGAPDVDGGLWQYNPLNAANGGPMAAPGELFQPDSAAQAQWLRWVGRLVERWHARPNLAAWEIFSELNLASGAPGAGDPQGAPLATDAVYFVNQTAAVIRAADPQPHPLTLSLAGGSGMPLTGAWPELYRLPAVDFIQIHPYTSALDREIVADVRAALAEFNKPVLIGESGLWGDLAIAPNAYLGVQHAIWAGVVSGAMNARALWSNDGYAFFEPDRDLAVQYMQLYATAELPAAAFAQGVDFTDFVPIAASLSDGVWGAALGNERAIIAWFREARCEAPDWKLQPMVANQVVTLTVPGDAAAWQVDFYSTADGQTRLGSVSLAVSGSALVIPLPDFHDGVALKLTAQAAPVAATPLATETRAGNAASALAGDWTGSITSAGGDFSTRVDLSFQPDCAAGAVCGTFAAPALGCSGSLTMQTSSGATFLFQEQTTVGAGSGCVSGGYERLTLQPDGTLFYEYLAAPDGAPASTGVFKHP